MSFEFEFTGRDTFALKCGGSSIELPMHLLAEFIRAQPRQATAPGVAPGAAPAPEPGYVLPAPVVVRPRKPPRPAVIGVIAGNDEADGGMNIARILSDELVPSAPLRFDLLDKLGPDDFAAIEAAVRARLNLPRNERVVLDVALDSGKVGRRYSIATVQSIVDNPANGIGAIRLIAGED